MSSFIPIHLEGTHQSWSGAGRGFDKDTCEYPTHSGVCGLVAASLGLMRDNPLVDDLHHSLRVSSRVLRQGQIHIDYQNARFWDVNDVEPPKAMPQSLLVDFTKHVGFKQRATGGVETVNANRQICRAYHTGAAFQVVLEILENCPFTAAQILEALRHPVMPVYLGRRSCRLSHPMVGPTTTVVEAAHPCDVFCAVHPHVKSVVEQTWENKRDWYRGVDDRKASLHLGPKMEPPKGSLPVVIADYLLSNRARSFTTRTAYLWATKSEPKEEEA